ncbi:MAG: putative metal-binding motif-containing protein [Acidobacteria bacterium]|nr:putative metal-binding motif-containing protein [Acidobacteriota bacterium]
MRLRNKILLCTSLLALSTILALGISRSQRAAGTQGSMAVRQDKAPPTERNSFSEEKPLGRWSIAAVPDVRQGQDTVTPVVISGISSLAGKDKWAGMLKVIQVKLTNRSPKTLTAVRLGWVIITAEDREARKPDRLAKLLEGYTPLFDVILPGGETRRVDSPVINFIKEARPLIKNGALTGDFYLKVRVSEAQFEDGSIWQEGETAAFLKTAFRPLTPQTEFNCPNTHCISSNSDGKLDRCTDDTQPGLSCWLNMASCGDGFCICNNDTCDGCKDEDGDGVWTCQGDCDDRPDNAQAFLTHPGESETCDDGIDNDCNGFVDGADPDCTPTPPPSTPTPTPSAGGGCPNRNWMMAKCFALGEG